jgi:23S rRNA pseudouridine1911/1915/1917 synthase
MGDLQTFVEAEAAGMRLDLFLTRFFSRAMERAGMSRSGTQRLIVEGRVTLNGHRTKASARLKVNDIVSIQSTPAREVSIIPEALPLDVLYEDRDCVVISKAAGVVVHPAAGAKSGTVVNALLHRLPSLEGIGGERRPGIVHRLDKETSGVMIIAKNNLAFEQLARQFKERRVVKEYVALVWGKLRMAKGVIERPIGRHRSDRKRMSSIHSLPRTREAITEWEVERCFEIKGGQGIFWISQLRLKPRTGRTHQIRVHLADLGYPLVGDKVYGRKRRIEAGGSGLIAVLQHFGRHALHAEKLGVAHPLRARPLQFHAPLALDIGELVRLLEEDQVLGAVPPTVRETRAPGAGGGGIRLSSSMNQDRP